MAQVTKQAFTFVFDRVTGRPVWPIEERPVPQSDVPGEQTSPTQPVPTKPPAFDRQGITPDDLVDFTPELRAEASKVLAQFRYGPVYTPPSRVEPNGTKGTLVMLGGASWTGGGVDPETGILYISSFTRQTAVALQECAPGRTIIPTMRYCGAGFRFPDVQGIPITKPPWGRITAIGLNTGDLLWSVANADLFEPIRDHPMLKGASLPRTGTPGRTGLLVTKSLLFAGEGSGMAGPPVGKGGRMFHAYDKRTGEEISRIELPKTQGGSPMTYMVNGQQFIVLAVGAPGVAGELVALSLP